MRTGTWSWGTLRSVDLIPVVMDALKEIDEDAYASLSEEYADTIKAVESSENDWDLEKKEGGEWASELYEEASMYINAALPQFWYWGATDGDGALIGVWPSCIPSDKEDLAEFLEYWKIGSVEEFYDMNIPEETS